VEFDLARMDTDNVGFIAFRQCRGASCSVRVPLAPDRILIMAEFSRDAIRNTLHLLPLPN